MGQPTSLNNFFTTYMYDRPVRGDMKKLTDTFMGPGRGNLSFQFRFGWRIRFSQLGGFVRRSHLGFRLADTFYEAKNLGLWGRFG